MGDIYLNIVESKNRDNGGFERQSVILFADDLQEFLKGFDESLKVLEKSVRDKRHSKPKRSDDDADFDERHLPRRNAEDAGGARHTDTKYGGKNRQGKRREDGDNRWKKDRSDHPHSGEKYAKRQKPQREFDRKPDFEHNNRSGGNKRIVVKKKR